MSCAPRIIAAIDQAQKSIYVQAYSLTSKSIAQALINAHRRGVIVQVLLDGSQNPSRFGQSQSLLAAGIPVTIEKVSGLAPLLRRTPLIP